ncbi:MAG: hypothetical protein ABI208_02705, partial [Ginsengibacter sp.]
MNPKLNYSSSFLENFSRDIESLEKNVQEYPNSALVNFLLLSSYHNVSSPKYNSFQKKAILYFQNPAWLHFQLQQAKAESLKSEVKNFSEIEENSELNSSIPEIEEENKETQNSIINQEDEIVEESTIQDELQKVEEIYDTNFAEGEKPAEVLPPEEIENVNEDLVILQEDEIVEESTTQDELQKVEEIENTELVEEEKSAEVLPQEEIENVNEDPVILQEDEIVEKIAPQDEKKEVEEIGNIHALENENSDGISNKEEKQEKKLEEVIPTPENEEEELLFQPLSMSDYFASQGISIKSEVIVIDKLGRQMKSFTDWLRDMKRLHGGKLPDQNPAVERMIQLTAEKSNVDAEILTETMAKILLKQEKPEKAIDLYK